MKQNELKKCAICGKGVMHTGVPFFYRLSLERMAIDVAAVKRQHGLEMMMGNAAALAFHMGPQEDIAQGFMGPFTLLICEDCSTTSTMIAQLLESAVVGEEEAAK